MRNYLAAALILAATGPLTYAQEWTRFRGSNGAGESDVATIPSKWSESDYNWKVELPGVGHSSPVVWGDRIFVTSGDPTTGERFVLCRRVNDGSEIWRKRFPGSAYHLHGYNSYTSATPAVDREHVYVVLVTPQRIRVQAFDHEGKSIWERDLGGYESRHGPGASPIVFGDLVVVSNDQRGDSFLVALDRTTGKPVWKQPRASGPASYSTPCVYTPLGGQPQLIFNSSSAGVCSIDPRTGGTNWQLADAFRLRTVSSPVVVAGLVFGSCGSGGGGNYVVAVRPPEGKSNRPQIVYRMPKSAPYVPTPVAYGELVFFWSDKGIVTCIDASTSKLHWRKRVGGNFFASPIRIADRIYGVSREGEVVVLAADKEYRLLARNRLGDASSATPAVAAGRLYLRTEHALISLGGDR